MHVYLQALLATIHIRPRSCRTRPDGLYSDDFRPLGDHRIVHEFFDERKAPVAFKSLEAQPILHLSRFGVSQNGDTFIKGIGDMSVRPHFLARYTLTFSDDPAVAALPDRLGWAGESNMDTMTLVAADLAMNAYPTLGE